MMFSIRSFVLYAVGTSMCGGLLVLLCLPLCALLRRLRAPSKLLCLLWLAVGLRFLLPGGIPVSIRQPGSTAWGTLQALRHINAGAQHAKCERRGNRGAGVAAIRRFAGKGHHVAQAAIASRRTHQ